MTNPYGVIDLSTLKKSASAQNGQLSGDVEVVNEANIETILRSTESRIVLLVVSSDRVPEGAEFIALLQEVIAAKQSSVLSLAVLNADEQPRLAQALRVQTLPTTFLLIKGQPQPIFQGVQPRAQLEPLLDEILKISAQEGIVGEETAGEQAPLPPLHQEALEALQRGDQQAAAQAYEAALAEDPQDLQAKCGLATVRLMQRIEGVDLNTARSNAAGNPDDLGAQLLVADLDMSGGHVEDALGRVLDLMRAKTGDEREPLRRRILEYFDIVGPDDERVLKARKRLALLLY